MARNCKHCGKEIGSWAYLSHGERFCSIECMNKKYRLGENAAILP